MMNLLNTYAGMPVVANELCTKQVTHIKKWKRLNRLSKVKTKILNIPTAYVTTIPPFAGIPGRKYLLCHPKVIEMLKSKGIR